MRLLIIQVLNAMLDFSQKDIRLCQSLRRFCGHQPRFGNALKRIHGGARAKLWELSASNHLQELHSEFNFANTAARKLDVVGALRMTCTPFGGVIEILLVLCS
jgi:hypothetical protein